MRIVDIWFNITTEELLDSTGVAVRVRDYPRIHNRENVMVNLRLVTDEDLTPYTGLEDDSVEAYSVALDNEYNNGESDYLPMCETGDADFNQAGDWDESDDTADPATGEMSFPLDADTPAYDAKALAIKEVKRTQLELKVKSGAGAVVSIFQFPFRAFNIIDND